MVLNSCLELGPNYNAWTLFTLKVSSSRVHCCFGLSQVDLKESRGR
jgi:hypothetical protein